MKKSTKIILGIVAMVILYFVLFPSLPIKFLKDIKQSLQVEDKRLQTQIDSINNIRIIDKNKYDSALKHKDTQLKNISLELEQANRKVRRYELQIIDYRNSTYNERFVVFTKLITEADAVQR